MAKSWKNIFELNQIVQVFGILIAISLIWNTIGIVQKNYGLQAQVDKLHDEIAILQLQNQQLKYDIEYFKTDEYLELAAREKFNQRAAGERVVALPQEDAEDPLPQEEQDKLISKPQYEENLEQWLYFLFGREPT